jgi:hypothetical protein
MRGGRVDGLADGEVRRAGICVVFRRAPRGVRSSAASARAQKRHPLNVCPSGRLGMFSSGLLVQFLVGIDFLREAAKRCFACGRCSGGAVAGACP